jgi:hypothetical protein
MKSSSFFVEHPWMTFFLGMAVVNGGVIAVRGYGDRQPALGQPPLLAPSTRGTYRP